MVIHSNILVWRIPMDRGAWKATVHGVAKSWTQLKRLSMHAHTHKPPSMAKKLINRHFIKKKKKNKFTELLRGAENWEMGSERR